MRLEPAGRIDERGVGVTRIGVEECGAVVEHQQLRRRTFCIDCSLSTVERPGKETERDKHGHQKALPAFRASPGAGVVLLSAIHAERRQKDEPWKKQHADCAEGNRGRQEGCTEQGCQSSRLSAVSVLTEQPGGGEEESDERVFGQNAVLVIQRQGVESKQQRDQCRSAPTVQARHGEEDGAE